MSERKADINCPKCGAHITVRDISGDKELGVRGIKLTQASDAFWKSVDRMFEEADRLFAAVRWPK